jgi:dTDP-glucose 4,6-dehydratase
MDSGKIARDLGWQPRHTLTEGLLATIEWYLSHPDWVTAIRKQQEYQTWLSKNYDEREKSS